MSEVQAPEGLGRTNVRLCVQGDLDCFGIKYRFIGLPEDPRDVNPDMSLETTECETGCPDINAWDASEEFLADVQESATCSEISTLLFLLRHNAALCGYDEEESDLYPHINYIAAGLRNILKDRCAGCTEAA